MRSKGGNSFEMRQFPLDRGHISRPQRGVGAIEILLRRLPQLQRRYQPAQENEHEDGEGHQP